MNGSRTIGDYALAAFLDEETSADRRREIDLAMAEDAALGERLANWRHNDEMLRAAFNRIVDEPVPAALALDIRAAAKSDSRFDRGEPMRLKAEGAAEIGRAAQQRGATFAAFAALSFIAGVTLAVCAGEAPSVWPTFFRAAGAFASPDAAHARARLRNRAIEAFRTFRTIPRSRIEASDRRDIAHWLSQRVAAAIETPHLEPLGLRLVGGQLTPGDLGPAALIFFAAPTGARTAIFVGRTLARSTSLRYDEKEGVGMAWWSEDGVAYAVLGPRNPRWLTKIALETKKQNVQTNR